MKHKFIYLFFITALIIGGCQKENSVTAPEDSNLNNLTIDENFKRSLEAEIQSEDNELKLDKSNFNWITEPAVITSPGIYVVANNFSVTSGDGIVIQSDHVLLWLKGHTITGPGNKDGRGIVLDGVKNVLVFGGKIETFGIGAALLNTSWSSVKGVKVKGGDEFADPPAGVAPQIGLLLLNSNNNFILWNDFKLINLGIFVRGGGSFNNKIFLNSAHAGVHGLLGICYNPAPGAADGPTNDNVFFNTLKRFGTGIQASIHSAHNKFNFNKIHYFNSAWEDLNGSNQFFHNKTILITP